MGHARAAFPLLLLALAGCIIRAESPEERRTEFDRSGLDDVLVSDLPRALLGGPVEFEDGIRFRGYAVDPAAPRPGDRVNVDFYWEAVDGPQDNWKVFVHLEPVGSEAGRLNADHEPAEGRYPTDVWQSGELVRDRWSVTVPGHLAGSRIEVWTGFYQGDERLAVVTRGRVRHDGRNRVMVGLITVQ